jgi:hypothetical protein
VDVSGEQETKTRKALQYFAKSLKTETETESESESETESES